jgi:hypothetical protein
MTRVLVVAIALAMLAGCDQRTTPRGVDEPLYRILANPNEPIVSVMEDGDDFVIVVDQEPVFHKKHAADKKTTWTLDGASRQNWKLVDVVIDPPGDTVIKDCAQVGGADHMFRCKTNLETPGTYKYKMTVERRSDAKRVTSPDPFIRNGR